MLCEVQDSVTRQLHELTDGVCKVYTQSVQQNLRTPCFIVQQIVSNREGLLYPRAWNRYHFNIVYLPSDDSDTAEQMAETLTNGMKLLTLMDSSMVWGSGIEGRVIDGDLHFEVRYALLMTQIEQEGERMSKLEVEIDGK